MLENISLGSTSKIFDNINIGHITYRKSKTLIPVSSRDVTMPIPIPSLPLPIPSLPLPIPSLPY
jgi:hypothetical protein